LGKTRIMSSPNKHAPCTPANSVVNRLDNSITANTSRARFLFIGQRVLPPEIFADGFEAPPPP
jgi:hypothetical protein